MVTILFYVGHLAFQYNCYTVGGSKVLHVYRSICGRPEQAGLYPNNNISSRTVHVSHYCQHQRNWDLSSEFYVIVCTQHYDNSLIVQLQPISCFTLEK